MLIVNVSPPLSLESHPYLLHCNDHSLFCMFQPTLHLTTGGNKGGREGGREGRRERGDGERKGEREGERERERERGRYMRE